MPTHLLSEHDWCLAIFSGGFFGLIGFFLGVVVALLAEMLNGGRDRSELLALRKRVAAYEARS